MIDRKTPLEIARMREGGQRLGSILDQLLAASRPGVSLLDIDALADELIAKAGGTPSFKTVEGYRWATCLCVNEVIVHGIPTTYTLKEGDVFTIDVGMVFDGFHTDTAWTKIIQNPRPKADQSLDEKIKNQKLEEKVKFLHVGEDALWKGIAQAKIGNRVGHISQTIEQIILPAGYSIVRTLVGHGVGRTLHEDPQIPGFLKGALSQTPELAGGETLAIEIIYAKGAGTIVYDNTDGWTLATKDRSLSAVFEHTIAVTPDGPIVLTKG